MQSLDGNKERECLEYFRSDEVWKRLFTGFREKYYSYGAFVGTVVLRGVKPAEVETLEGFFGKNFHGKKSISISTERFTKALKQSRYGEIEPDRLLELYFKEPMLGKKQERDRTEQRKKEILKQFQSSYESTYANEMTNILQEVLKKSHVKQIEEWERLLYLGGKILDCLPKHQGKTMYLAVFATRLTGNPHAFDKETAEGNFFYQLIQKELEYHNMLPEHSEIFPAFFRQQCYLKEGILIDDVSNYAMLSGIRAEKNNGKNHKGLQGFYEEGDMVVVPLTVLAGWNNISCIRNEIYIVENPSVFATICAKGENKISAMCMNGQPRLAGLLVLDMLAKTNTTVYYAGDFDPEGLLIAQKLAHYYKGTFHYWHMDAADYEKSRSREVISDRRLKMLDNITDDELMPVVQQMREYGVAGYQERVLDLLFK